MKKRDAAITTIACPLARTASLIGDEWILLILRELFKHPSKFDGLQKATGAATNILTQRLQRMLDEGIIKKVPYQERPVRYQYQLKRAGYAMMPMLLEMMRYSEEWFPSPEAAPNQLRHLACRQITKAGQICSQCGEALTLENVRLESNETTALEPETVM